MQALQPPVHPAGGCAGLIAGKRRSPLLRRRSIPADSFEFLVQGSEAEPYRVAFRFEDRNCTATCTCRAGQVGQACKHRLGIIWGVVDGLVSDNADDLVAVRERLPDTDVWDRIERLRDAEEDLADAKARVSVAKKALARAMRD